MTRLAALSRSTHVARKMKPPPDWLVGRWRLLRADPTLEFSPGTRMDFREHGDLRYRIPVEGREQEFALLYVVEGDVLRTDNPSAPHATATRFHLGAGGVLVFDFAGALAVFVREEDY
jgi:hypothetical protein